MSRIEFLQLPIKTIVKSIFSKAISPNFIAFTLPVFLRNTFLLLFLGVLFATCNNSNYYPKPRGYFRIDFPEKNYRTFDSIFPYKFEYPVYAQITFDKYTRQNQYWMNLDYPHFNGRIHISYKSLKTYDLYQLTEDTRRMAFKHAPKSIGIKEMFFNNPATDVFGLAYKIEGSDAASPFQFYITDSTHHFLRGALYFNVTPNNDSLQPVIDFILDDIDHLLKTLNWKEVYP